MDEISADLINGLVIGVVGVAMSILTSSAKRNRNKVVKKYQTESGQLIQEVSILQYSQGLKVFPFVFMIIALVLCIVVVSYPNKEPGTLLLGIFAFSFFSIFFIGIPWWLFIETRYTVVLLSPNGIEKYSLLGGRQSLKWDEVRWVSYDLVGQVITLHSMLKPLRVETTINGIGEVAKSIKKNISPEKWPNIRREIEELAS